MENTTPNLPPVSPLTPQQAKAPNSRKRVVLLLVLGVVIVLLVLVFVRAVRNRQGVDGLLRFRSGSQTTNTTNNSPANNTATNTPANTTNSTPQNNTSPSNSNTTTTPSNTYSNPLPAGATSITVEHDGINRTAIIYVPKSNTASKATSIVFNFHGGESDAKGQENNSKMDTTAENNGFIVVYPNGINKNWNDGRSFSKKETNNADDVGFTTKLLDTIATRQNVDRARVYAAGMSNGGMMSYRLACEKTKTFAAVAIVAGAFPTELQSICKPNGTIPMVIMHGTSDPIIPFNGGNLPAGRGAVPSVEDVVKYWVGIDGVDGQVALSAMVDTSPKDGITISRKRYGDAIEFYEIGKGGHTWPGGVQYAPILTIGRVSRDMDGSQVIWDFFKKHSR